MRRAVLLLVCCCACLGGKKPQYTYLVLTPTFATKPAPALASSTAEHPSVGVSQVIIPRYLDRESIVTRISDYHVDYSKLERWAEPLDEAFSRTLRHDLATALAPSGIAVPSRTAAPTFDLQVDILRFERRLDTNRVELWARWSLRSNNELVHTSSARIEVTIASTTSDAVAAALSQAIARLAGQIAAQVRLAYADGEGKAKSS